MKTPQRPAEGMASKFITIPHAVKDNAPFLLNRYCLFLQPTLNVFNLFLYTAIIPITSLQCTHACIVTGKKQMNQHNAGQQTKQYKK